MVKRFLRTIILSVFLIAAAQVPASAYDVGTCKIINGSDMSIAFLYAVPMDSDGWGEDLVGSEIMNINDGRTIDYEYGNPIYKIKIQLAGEGGETFTWYDVDLTDTWNLTIWYNGTDFELSKNSVG